MRERSKELNFLYAIPDLVEQPGISLAEICQGTVELILPAWLRLEVMGARIVLEGPGFFQRNLPEEKEAHLRQIRAEGFPPYTIRPEGERPEYTSIERP